MFIQAVFISVIVGYLLRGRLKNLENTDLQGIWLIAAGFGTEFLVVMSMKSGLLSKGILTLVIDLMMYILLFWFVYINRRDYYVFIMGVGFLLNAIPIFLNGGAMPVDIGVYKSLGISAELAREGLYTAIDQSTKAWFLGDIFPYHFIGSKLVFSAGDVVIAIGLMLFIITGMKRHK